MSGLFGFASGFGRRVTAHGSELSPFCTSPTQLQDVKKAHNISNSSLTNSIGVRTREHQSDSTRRSMREQEEQLAALHKENFNLKLRVYFLEEREAGNAGGYDACSKQNVELKIEVESLKNDLDTKQELLQQAAQAIELMEDNQRESTRDFEKKILALENKIFDLEDELKVSSSRSSALDNKQLMVAMESTSSDISEEFYKKQNAIVDLENKVYELQSEILARDTTISEVTKELETQNKHLKRQEVLLEQRGLDIAQLQMGISGYKIQISELQSDLEKKERELRAFQVSPFAPSNINNELVGGEPNLIRGNYADPGEIQHLRDLLAKRNSLIKKHEDAHKCACRVIQSFMQKNKEMSRQIEKYKKQNIEISNSLPLPSCESEASSGISPVKLSKTYPSQLDSPFLSDEAKHEREAENKGHQNEIETLEKFYKGCLQSKGDAVINFKGNSSQSGGDNSQKICKEVTDLVPIDYFQIKEENQQLFLQIQELQTELRNTPERDYDNIIRLLQKEVDQYKSEHDKMKSELQSIQKSSENISEDNIHWQDVCITLKEHLEELAGFLMSLLKSDLNMSMMSDKIESIRQAVDKSLDLSRSVSLSVSGVMREGNSLIQLSSLSAYLENSVHSGIEKLSSDSSHDNIIMDQAETISNLQNEISALKKQLHNKHSKKSVRCELDLSESEAWSEPDKDVSMSRIGLKDLSNISPRRRSGTLKNNQRSFARKLSMDDSQDNLEKLYEDIKVLELKLSESEKKLIEGQVVSLKADSEFKEEKLKMFSQLESLKLEKVQSDNSLKETLEKLASMEIMISKFRKQINELNDLIAGQKNVNEENTLKLKLTEDKLNALQLERDVKEADAKFAEQNLRHLQKEMKDLTNKYLNLKSENEKISVSLTESLQVNEELCDQIKSLREEENHVLKDHLNEISNLTEKFNNDLENNWIAKVDFDSKCVELENILKSLEEKENIILNLENSEEKKLMHLEEEYQNQLRDTKYKESELLKKFLEKETQYKAASKHIDALTMQMSQITVERTRISSEKFKLEKEINVLKSQNEKNLSEMQLRISELERANAQIQNRLITLQTSSNLINKFRGPMSEASSNSSDEGAPEIHDRLNNSSPDLGIESDPGNASSGELASIERPLLKSLELTQSMSNILDFEKPETASESDRVTILEKENVELRQKLVAMRRTLKEALGQILAANKRKKQVEKEITAQLCKTHGVLRQVRSNLESGSNVNT